jgi:enoyl-[acyl-carrier protein] reductase III
MQNTFRIKLMSQSQHKIAFVSGGTRGVGAYVVRRFLSEGIGVVTTYRKDEANAQVFEKEISAEFPDLPIWVRAVDMGDASAMEALFTEIQSSFGRLDYLVANAAATAFKPLREIKPHHIEKTMAITVTGFLIASQWVARLAPPEGAAIVAVSGYDTHTCLPRHGVLGAAKSAMETLVAYLAVELADQKIRVNAVNPGFIDTTSAQIYMGSEFEEIRKQNQQWTPLGRITDGKEIADLIWFLCQPEAAWLCGSVLRADGGLRLRQPLVLPKV